MEWTDKLQDAAREKSTLRYLNIEFCKISYLHPAWQGINCDLDIKKATVKAQLLVQRYPLATSPTAPGNRSDVCPLCRDAKETTVHFLLQCPCTMQARLPYLKRVLSTCRTHKLSIDPDNLARVFLDTTSLSHDDLDHERLCRNMVFKIHHWRALLLEGDSAYKLARK